MSAKPQALSAISKLATRRKDLENRFHESFLLNEVEARRLSKELKAEIEKGYLNLKQRGALLHEFAYVEALRGRLDAALLAMDQANGCGLDELAIAISKSHILIMFGQFLRARSVLENIELETVPVHAKGSLQGLCEEVGMYKSAAALRVSDHPWASFSAEANEALNDAAINELDVTERLEFAAAIVQKFARHRLIAYDLFAARDEGILFRFVIDGPLDELLELDWEITKELASKFRSDVDDILSIGIKPFSVGEQRLEYGAYRVDV